MSFSEVSPRVYIFKIKTVILHNLTLNLEADVAVDVQRAFHRLGNVLLWSSVCVCVCVRARICMKTLTGSFKFHL